ncbi:MAG TPA: serine O-acetyltransferase [Flavisolibacter sp.]|nr:serine O-acetyltransferase [Flavisolibacter sp.]
MDEAIFINELVGNKMKTAQQFPDKAIAERFVDDIFRFLFIGSTNEVNHIAILEKHRQLKIVFASLIYETVKEQAEVKKHTTDFFYQLPSVYKALLEDAQAILDFDPAARNMSEVVVAYPGFFAIAVYRLSHQIWSQGIRLLPRLFSEYAHSKTGIDIHPAAQIGAAFAIDHGTGIVIGETTVIGNHVKIYQGVTLGALNVAKSQAATKRHPTIEDEVVIYSGATILGGDTVIGKGSIIGGNVWLTHSISPNSVVYHKSEIKIKDKNPFPEPLNFII